MLLKNKLNKVKTFLDNDNVLTSLEERYCYVKDASNMRNSTTVPDLVVFVKTIEEVQKVVKYANEHSIPIIPRGAGSNMVGACVSNNGGIVLNFSKMDKILEINPQSLYAKVQPGVVLAELKSKVEELGLFYPPDPSSYRICTIGGTIAQSSGGARTFKYGTTKDYVLSLKVVLADGSLVTLGFDTIKNSAGYHLAQLMVGSEGTLGIIVEATLKLIPAPEAKSTVVAYFSTMDRAVNSIDDVLSSKIFPAAIDFMDKKSIRTVEDFLPSGLNTKAECLLLIELDGMEAGISYQEDKIREILFNSGALQVELPKGIDLVQIWRARNSSFAAATRLAPDVVSDDIIVPRENLVRIILKCYDVAEKYSLELCLIGHVGDGNIHPQFVLDLDDELQYRNYMNAKAEIYASAKELGGCISAEHGIGLDKSQYLNNLIENKVLDYMKELKRVFDPKNILNPGKIFK